MPRLEHVSRSFLALALSALLAGPAAAYQVITVSEGGTISGKVEFQGLVPSRKVIPTKDRDTCGKIRDEPEVNLGSDKGVQDAVVYLKKLTKGKAWEKPGRNPELVNKGCEFVPRVQALPVGASLVTLNEDPVLHNIHSFSGKSTVFNVALPIKGQKAEKHLDTEGMIRFECDAHGWMRGYVYVADNPYYTVTAENGTFVLPDVPPGSYTLVAWQEYAGATEIPVTVEAKKVAQVTVELKKK
jgi:Carboxypeptidase regulatory-like domain